MIIKRLVLNSDIASSVVICYCWLLPLYQLRLFSLHKCWVSECVCVVVDMRLSQVLYPLHDGKLFVQLLSEVCRELLLLFDYDYLLNRSFDLLIIRSVAKCNIPAQSNKTKQMSYSCCYSRHRNRQQLQDDNR